jgi:hypothetical protein
MTPEESLRRSARPIRPVTGTHLFAIGQLVRLRSGFGSSRSAQVYRITGTLPPRADSAQYRIRNDDERHERVTTQDNLEPVRALPAGERTILERTFGHGEGTETRQPRDQKTETKKTLPKPLWWSLDMPQQPDAVTIRDGVGTTIYSGRFDPAENSG